MKNKLMLASLGISLALSLAACGQSAEQENTTTIPDQGQEVTEENPSQDTIENNDSPSATPRESEKEIKVHVEGEIDLRKATLQKSNLGYLMYVLDRFRLENEEPNKDVLISEYDEEFFVRIEKLDKEVNYEELQQNLTSVDGETIIEENPENLFIESFRDAKFYLIKDVGEYGSPEGKTTVLYIGKEFNGKPFLLTFHLPLKEAAEGIGPSFWAMLSTIE